MRHLLIGCFLLAVAVVAWTPAAEAQTCFTRCAFFLEYACEDGVRVGGCFGFWGCDAGIGAHTCGSHNDDLPIGSVCENHPQCATDRCERGVCVCKRDGDCPSGQKCKKPLFGQNRCE